MSRQPTKYSAGQGREDMLREYTRRDFLRKAVTGVAAGSVLVACQPKVVEVEKIVKETVEGRGRKDRQGNSRR